MAYVVVKTGQAVEGLGEWEQADRDNLGMIKTAAWLYFGLRLSKFIWSLAK